ncbi:hypothetical protein [Bradyrhizobium sp. CCGB20]|uniref:hypothetical protein n=1 Tax=Bradyrhizobium sp. CCGB20 TaxID=2949633 RepID=UPI0020B3BEA8|nr:hypothetical protein [Bradyrhizobium sp. CCGB20]MCP3399193.1 hypothetical protein [Bradyrhizobium sp. CCGB20]
MAFEPTKADHAALDQFLETVFDAYKAGRADRNSCVGAIAHVMTAAAIDNEAEFKNYIRLSEQKLFDFGTKCSTPLPKIVPRA